MENGSCPNCPKLVHVGQASLVNTVWKNLKGFIQDPDCIYIHRNLNKYLNSDYPKHSIWDNGFRSVAGCTHKMYYNSHQNAV